MRSVAEDAINAAIAATCTVVLAFAIRVTGRLTSAAARNSRRARNQDLAAEDNQGRH
jgi:hypothetical protein